MKKALKLLLNAVKWIFIVLLCIVVLSFIVRNIGRAANRITPEGGINEEMYLDINGTNLIMGKDGCGSELLR